MPALQHNITIEVGANFHLPLLWREADKITPINLAGYSVRMQVRRRYADAEALLSLTSDGGGITIGASEAGSIDVRATAAQTALLPLDRSGGIHGVYDLEIEKDGVVARIVQGIALISSEVTR